MLDIFLLIFIIILIIIIILYVCNKINNSTIYNVSCAWKRWGCCKDNLTPKLDIFGSNCRGF